LTVDPTRHCSQEELAQGEALLDYDAWQHYPDVAFTSTTTDDPAAEENGGPQSNVDHPVGYVRVERIGFPSGTENQKHFDADTTGPEAELIAYFRGLQAKYGED
jgi:hypothetical protein